MNLTTHGLDSAWKMEHSVINKKLLLGTKGIATNSWPYY